MLETAAIERLHEDVGREVFVAVLLHVEIDELRDRRTVAAFELGFRCRAEKELEAIAEDAGRVLAGERRNL
ncbi:MAG: hypothetical protein QM820_39660 [Minicystis sp.]